MPELPEVQTVVDVLNTAGVTGHRIVGVSVRWPKSIATSGPEAFAHQIQGKTILCAWRRAKYIIFDLSGSLWLLVHLRMTGRLALVSRPVGDPTHVHVTLSLDDGRSLIFQDTRKFGRFYLTAAPDLLLRKLGPEPLDSTFTAHFLAGRLRDRKRQIKPLLLDQSFLAGLGNIYVDEALWAAAIHPLRSAHSLSWNEVRSLHRAIRAVLRQGIHNAGTSLGTGKGNFISPQSNQGRNAIQLKVFRRTGLPCKRCGGLIERMVVGQRSTHICSTCQRAPES